MEIRLVSVFRFARTIFRANLNSRVLNSHSQNLYICADLNSRTQLWIKTTKLIKIYEWNSKQYLVSNTTMVFIISQKEYYDINWRIWSISYLVNERRFCLVYWSRILIVMTRSSHFRTVRFTKVDLLIAIKLQVITYSTGWYTEWKEFGKKAAKIVF